MKPAPFTYVRAKSLGDVHAALADTSGARQIIAGGQSLGPMLNLRLTQLDKVIDISRVPELRRIEDKGSVVRIGAAIRHAEIEDGKVPAAASAGLMPRAARTLAYRSVRNRGTIGGSLANADPVADWPTVMSALGASVELSRSGGRREVPLAQLFVGYLTTALEPDEVLEAVLLPKIAAGARTGFYKFNRKHGEFAHSICAVVASPQPGATRVVLGSAGTTPLQLKSVAAIAAGGKWRDGIEAEIRKAVAADIATAGKELDDYDAHLHGTIVTRAMKEALA